MPTDPNARGNSILSDILKAMNKQNDLLAAQNKILDRMEKHSRPTIGRPLQPYLERSDGQPGRESGDQTSDGSPAGGVQGTVSGGASDSSGTSVEGGLSGLSGR